MTADLGTAREIDARAHGEPGQRTFEIRVIGANYQSASFWVEKQQIEALNMALTQVLAQLNLPTRRADTIGTFPEGPDHSFRVGRMAIGFDTSNSTVVLQVFEISRDEDEEDPDVQVRITEDACASLNTRLQEIIEAGRPICPLCRQSMDPEGHACIRSNGHSKQPIPDRLEDDEEDA